MESKFTAIFEKTDGWYIGYVEELPGANTQGQTLGETRENLREAIELILLSNRELTEKGLSNKKFIRHLLSPDIVKLWMLLWKSKETLCMNGHWRRQ